MPGGRSQVPLDQECPGCLAGAGRPLRSTESLARLDSSESTSERTCVHPEIKVPKAEELRPRGANVAREHVASPPGRTSALETALLEALLDLVDRHWGGCRSLHGNEAFLAQARHILSSVQALPLAQDKAVLESEEISYLALENESLRGQLAEQQQQHSTKMSEARLELEAVRSETDDLKQCLDKSLEENSSLKSLLFSMKKEAKSADTAATLNVQLAGKFSVHWASPVKCKQPHPWTGAGRVMAAGRSSGALVRAGCPVTVRWRGCAQQYLTRVGHQRCHDEGGLSCHSTVARMYSAVPDESGSSAVPW
ncbi:centrosomal protein of 72 kDa-like isoform X1 [Elephas maximus indicus]|uniref:centrosomal protein of 72 kDa-like isoform X1 n=1 Tax=Elephas maximus indicus TaxID=99487 RepID=UPI00211676FD|nr:centrosomal protein of 72 kDa-like isoform X1 [Elephas maximus indicus]XP_049715840.1 centrosomal protein of 72 kDa-like isoform X1 [Elephas maximus indicus]